MDLLAAVGISKSFGGVRALKDVSFNLRAGEVHALIGENGAGKSTLIKVLTGAVQKDGGQIFLDGALLEHNDPARARALGIAVIYQQPALFPDLSVAENIALAGGTGKPWTRVDWRSRRLRAAELLREVGASFSPDTLVSRLSMPQQQLVEIAKALDANARVLILDEPTASLGAQDAANLFGILDGLRAKGVGIIYISHRLEELFRIAERVTVLRDGESIDTRSMQGVTTAELIRMMVGRELDTVFPKQAIALGDVALEVRNLNCARRRVHQVSLSVRRGEIVGLAGLVGSGRTEFAETLFGLSAADGGEVLVEGRRTRIHSPEAALRCGLAYVPEDRRHHGVILAMPIATNTTLASLPRISRFGLLRWRSERQIAEDAMRRLGTKAPHAETLVGDLSGGNQQKVALSRWLLTAPKVLVLDEPTQGIDVGAKAEIYHLIGELAQRGMAILMISSELPEILGLSDRVAVMRSGSIVAILDRREATPHRVMDLALGQSGEPQ